MKRFLIFIFFILFCFFVEGNNPFGAIKKEKNISYLPQNNLLGISGKLSLGDLYYFEDLIGHFSISRTGKQGRSEWIINPRLGISLMRNKIQSDKKSTKFALGLGLGWNIPVINYPLLNGKKFILSYIPSIEVLYRETVYDFSGINSSVAFPRIQIESLYLGGGLLYMRFTYFAADRLSLSSEWGYGFRISFTREVDKDDGYYSIDERYDLTSRGATNILITYYLRRK